MFSLNERTERRIARTVFVAVCVLPTLATLVWIAGHISPGRTGRAESALSQLLGVQASFDDVAHPRPGVTVYSGVQLVDAEQSAPLAQFGSIEATETRAGLTVRAAESVVQCDGAGRLMERLKRALTARHSLAVQFVAGDVQLREGEKTTTLSDVHGELTASPAGARAALAFAPAGGPKLSLSRIQIDVPAAADGQRTQWELDTGATPLPCELLALAWPALDRLGAASRFRGRVQADVSPSGWSGELSGTLSGTRLESLLPAEVSHRLQGPAELVIEHARVRAGRLYQFAGKLSAGPGTFDESLAIAARENLGMQFAPSLQPPQGPTSSFEQLGLAVRLDRQGIVLRGACPAAKSTDVMVAQGRAIAICRDTNLLPIAALVRFLSPSRSNPQTGQLVPLTPQTAKLISVLPLADLPTR